MKLAALTYTLALTALWPMESAVAQTTRSLNVSYSGTVQDRPGETLTSNYPGINAQTIPLPLYPVNIGDIFGFSFDVNVPTAEFFATQTIYQPDTNGNYRFGIADSSVNYNSDGLGSITNMQMSDPFGFYAPDTPSSRLKNVQMVYNVNSDTYALDIDQWRLDFVAGPQFVYNQATSEISIGTACNFNYNSCPNAGFSMAGNGSSELTSSVFSLLPSDPIGNFFQPLGILDGFSVSGSWSLPEYSGSNGGATDVPAPPAALLIFGALAAVGLRRKKKAA